MTLLSTRRAISFCALLLASACQSSPDDGAGALGSGGGGSIACTPELTSCGQACVNLQNDPTHCGACGSACTPGQSCQNGACTCQGGLTQCGSSCVNLQSDGMNCGQCGTACTGGQACSVGACATDCAQGLTKCGSSCVDMVTDAQHCGSCDNVCPAGSLCTAGVCMCDPGLSLCGGLCVTTQTFQTDSSNCGSCGTVCTGGQTCSLGVCSGGSGTGGATGAGGSVGVGGSGGSGGSSSGGSGGTAAGGTGGIATGGAGGTGASGGSGGGTGGSAGSPGKVFSQCRFHFGTIDTQAKGKPSMIAELDFFTPGWMGISDTFDQKYVCDETNPSNGELRNQVPVIVAYVAAFYAKRHDGQCDCNVTTCGQRNGKPLDLCNFGSAYIQQNLTNIVNVYKSYAQGYANCFGTTRPIVLEMEPDFYQYTYDSQSDKMTPAEAASVMSQFVNAIKQYLPNAYFSMDISPWVAPNNGEDHGAAWYGNFDMSLFTFVNTSGGSTQGNDAKIRSSNNMTWAGVRNASGKPVLADTGYGVNGSSAGHDAAWDSVSNLNARIANGVLSISQYNPKSDWGTTISQMRSQLATPAYCP